MKDPRKCETCDFAHLMWRAGDEYPGHMGQIAKRSFTSYQCRHDPPVFTTDDHGFQWPYVGPTDWCGRWKKRIGEGQ